MPDKTRNNEMRKYLRNTGAPPEVFHAFNQTGLVVTDKNINDLSEDQIKAWNDAKEEWFTIVSKRHGEQDNEVD